MKKPICFSRRRALTTLGVGAGGAVVARALRPLVARADGGEPPPLFITAYFQGGWDTLLFADPRDNREFRVDHRGSTGALPPPIEKRRIETNYEAVAGTTTDGRSNGLPLTPQNKASHSGLVQPQGSNIVFGPAIGELQDHFDKLCVIRGIYMNTAGHYAGMRYFLTGRFPTRVVGEGNSLSSYVSGKTLEGLTTDLQAPNLSIGPLETYNADFGPKASALSITSPQEVAKMLGPIAPADAPTSAARKAIEAYQSGQPCLHRQLNQNLAGIGAVSAYRAAHDQTRGLLTGELAKAFANFAPIQTNSANAYSKDVTTAAFALESNLSQCVSLWLSPNLDHHFGNRWVEGAAADLRPGLDALAALITYLEKTPDKHPLAKGKTLWDRTRLLVFSEFARTPHFNRSGGRDHHLGNACIIAGAGIQGNNVIGRTDDKDYSGDHIEFAKTDTMPATKRAILPQDVHRTLCEAMGLEHDPQLDRNDFQPAVIPGALT